MDPKKVIVCRCEDVTLEDIYKAIEEGYTDLESLKRYLRIGMGPCQGAHCIPIVARILASKTGKKFDEIYIPGNRPPLNPIPLKYFLKKQQG
ncbi:(2Fe-2S)-binding protein [Desulfurococcaceae archaeon MEX13E-LK6-19]|nr:(2Fe-2S)-binding protein [Desulfurococcaceae archaeon MEX13E-LK6-19]